MHKVDRGPWITMRSGTRWYFLDPRPEEIYIEDIAWHLSMINRFAGATSEPYSVAQHSWHASFLCQGYELEGLLHDAHEAVLMDMPRPIKHTPEMKWYRDLCALNQQAICQRFTLGWPMPQTVYDADNVLLATEARDLMAESHKFCNLPNQPLQTLHIAGWSWGYAYDMFLGRFRFLMEQRHA